MNYQYHQVGKRKSAIARVYLSPAPEGEGKIVINRSRRSLENYFPRLSNRALIIQPLELTSNLGKFNIFVNVGGGGPSGQAGAIRHGIARAMLQVDPNYRPILKREGLITRDARKVERKKYGQAGARRRYQHSKR